MGYQRIVFDSGENRKFCKTFSEFFVNWQFFKSTERETVNAALCGPYELVKISWSLWLGFCVSLEISEINMNVAKHRGVHLRLFGFCMSRKWMKHVGLRGPEPTTLQVTHVPNSIAPWQRNVWVNNLFRIVARSRSHNCMISDKATFAESGILSGWSEALTFSAQIVCSAKFRNISKIKLFDLWRHKQQRTKTVSCKSLYRKILHTTHLTQPVTSLEADSPMCCDVQLCSKCHSSDVLACVSSTRVTM